MDILNRLIEIYESNENITVDEILTDVLKSDPEYAELSRQRIIEIKRSFMEYIRFQEDQDYPYERRDNPYEESKDELSPDVLETVIKKEKEYRRSSRPRKRYVEAFINNISVATSLEEMSAYSMHGNDAQHLIEEATYDGWTEWSAPRWAKQGDIVLFMHSKTANSTLTRLRTEVRNTLSQDSAEAIEFENAIADQLAFHKEYGGKIFAIGRVNGETETLEVDPIRHTKSRTFCLINKLYLLDEPIHISEFNSFILVSRQGGITPVYGRAFEELKGVIAGKNELPDYFARSYSTPFPHSLVNRENWMQLGLEYRNSFTLEIQFRQCYVDYLLKQLGDRKSIFMECACYKGTTLTGYVDNVIWFNKKLLPVEVKLNIKLEIDLEGQCEKYCRLDRLVLDKKKNREAKIEDLVDDRVLVIDTYAIYMFHLIDKRIETLYDLSDLKSGADIEELRGIIQNAV